MENIDELKREAEEAKERVKKDMAEVGEILRKIADEAKDKGTLKAVEAVHRAEKRIDEMVERVEKRIEKAVAVVTESSSDSGGVVTREMDFADFTNVEVGHAFKVEITRADSCSVSITAGEKLFDHIDVVKSGNTLKISLKSYRFHIRPTLEARITMPTLNKLRLGGATRGTVTGFSSEEPFDLNLSGASALDIDMEAGKTGFEISGASRLSGNMKADDAELVLSGASRAELRGSANSVIVSAWGASKLDLTDFTLNDTSVNLKGASQARCGECCGNLEIDLSGASRLDYGGNPTMRSVNVSGASTIHQR